MPSETQNDLTLLIDAAPSHQKIAYVVYRNHTLGYMYKFNHPDVVYIGVLHASIYLGGSNPLNTPLSVWRYDFKNLRKATVEDFESFRVSSKYHEVS